MNRFDNYIDLEEMVDYAQEHLGINPEDALEDGTLIEVQDTEVEYTLNIPEYERLIKSARRQAIHHTRDIVPTITHVYTNLLRQDLGELRTPMENVFSDSGSCNNVYTTTADTAVGIYINSKYYNVYTFLDKSKFTRKIYEYGELVGTVECMSNFQFTMGIVTLLNSGNRVMLFDKHSRKLLKVLSPDAGTIMLKRMMQLEYLRTKYQRITEKAGYFFTLNKYALRHNLPMPSQLATPVALDILEARNNLKDTLLELEQHKLERELITSQRRFDAEEVELDDYILPVHYDINVHTQWSENSRSIYVVTNSTGASWYNGIATPTNKATRLITTEADMSLQYYSQRWADEHGIERYTGDIEQNLAIHDGIQELIEAIKYTERCEDDFLRHEVRAIVFTNAEDFDLLVDAMYAIENDPHINLSRLI